MTSAFADRLKKAIDSKSNTELECGKILMQFPEFLVPHTVEEATMHLEYRGNSGIADVVVVAKIYDTKPRIAGFVWELKAPQTSMYVADGKNRLRPSNELYSAENQLSHYYQELKGSEQFKSENRILRSSDIQLGGIIMSSKSRMVKGDFDDIQKRNLGTRIIEARKVFYPSSMKVYTWDMLLRYLKAKR